ncbi:MAG: hypothetical protein L0H31_15080 [Nocardioidaceae bacterium]|nr:hypothetical protein [Nocardioidaceae bacterium]
MEANSEAHDQARKSVLEAARSISADLVDTLGGKMTGRGAFRGCAETATGKIDKVEYTVTARVDPGRGAPTPLLSAARPALAAAGLTPGQEREAPSGRSVSATKGELGASVTEVDGAKIVDPSGQPGAGRWLILKIAGPCLVLDEEKRVKPKPDVIVLGP